MPVGGIGVEPEANDSGGDAEPPRPDSGSSGELVGHRSDNDTSSSPSHVDTMRLRSFIGLSLGLVGPRANLAVSGVLLTLLVTQRATGGLCHSQPSAAVGITFALTSSGLIGWMAYPLLGRASDRTRVKAGRRVPYMAAGLAVMGVCTYSYTLVGGFWPLVGLVLLAKAASMVFGLNNVAAIPETFGKSRTLRAALFIGVVGTLVSLSVKFTAIATWHTCHASTYNEPFRVAGLFMIGCALVVLLLVREAPAAVELVEKDRRRTRPWREELRDILEVPNAKVLALGIFLFWSGVSATGYLTIVYFQDVQHAGANIQTVAGWITGVPALVIGAPIGFLIARLLPRKLVMISAPIVGSGLVVIQYFSTHFWQSVVLAVVGAPLFIAWLISGGVFLLQLLPRSGGLGELLGKFVAPFSISGVLFSFAGAWAVELTGNYRVIWVFPAVAYFGVGVAMAWLKVPPHNRRVPHMGGLLERLTEAVLDQVWYDRSRRMLGGVVTAQDADASTWFETARTIFGDPYAEPGPDGLRPGAWAAVRGEPAQETNHTSAAALDRTRSDLDDLDEEVLEGPGHDRGGHRGGTSKEVRAGRRSERRE